MELEIVDGANWLLLQPNPTLQRTSAIAPPLSFALNGSSEAFTCH